MSDLDVRGRIFNIQRYSIYDGEGVRTIVFLKGCNLHCPWCSNPESISYAYSVMYNHDKCNDCGKCIEVCDNNVHIMDLLSADSIKHKIDRTAVCNGCRKCEEVCIGKAIDIMGDDVTVREVMQTIMKDYDFYMSSDGGVTLSGGEASLQIDFACALFKECKKAGINTAIETQGSAPIENYERLAECCDQFLFDLKQIDDKRHIQVIGGSNFNIYNNLKRLVELKSNIVIRMPLIKGFNDTFEHLDGTFKHVINLNKINNSIKRIDILPYHAYGKSKYAKLGCSYNMTEKAGFNAKELSELKLFADKYDCNIKLIKH